MKVPEKWRSSADSSNTGNNRDQMFHSDKRTRDSIKSPGLGQEVISGSMSLMQTGTKWN